MMNALKAFNGYTIPYGRWPVRVSSYDEGKGKLRIFWIGRGSVNTVTCKFCHKPVDALTAHWHDGDWVGDACCWTEQLRTTE